MKRFVLLVLPLAFLGGYQLQLAQISLPVKAKGTAKDQLARPDQKEAQDKADARGKDAHPLPKCGSSSLAIVPSSALSPNPS